MLTMLKLLVLSPLLLVQLEAPACGTREVFVAILENDYGESSVALGLTRKGDLAEVYMSPDGSWTWMITSPDGTSCLVATGQSWESFPVQKEGRYD